MKVTPFAATIFQAWIIICSPGTGLEDCHNGSVAAQAPIIGPTVSSISECGKQGQQYLAALVAHGFPLDPDSVIHTQCAEIGQGNPPIAQYGKIGIAEFKRF